MILLLAGACEIFHVLLHLSLMHYLHPKCHREPEPFSSRASLFPPIPPLPLSQPAAALGSGTPPARRPQPLPILRIRSEPPERAISVVCLPVALLQPAARFVEIWRGGGRIQCLPIPQLRRLDVLLSFLLSDGLIRTMETTPIINCISASSSPNC